MAKPRNRSTLYRLIEAGQLAHRAFLAPMRERGLQPGDDALLLILAERKATSEELAAEAGVAAERLSPLLQRLIDRGLIERTPTALRLTARGAKVEAWLAAHWASLETLVTHGLGKKQRARLNRQLAEIAELLG